MDFASSVVAVVSGGHHRPADTSRVVDEQLVGGEASEAESGRSATVDLPAADRPVMSTTLRVEQCHDHKRKRVPPSVISTYR